MRTFGVLTLFSLVAANEFLDFNENKNFKYSPESYDNVINGDMHLNNQVYSPSELGLMNQDYIENNQDTDLLDNEEFQNYLNGGENDEPTVNQVKSFEIKNNGLVGNNVDPNMSEEVKKIIAQMSKSGQAVSDGDKVVIVENSAPVKRDASALDVGGAAPVAPAAAVSDADLDIATLSGASGAVDTTTIFPNIPNNIPAYEGDASFVTQMNMFISTLRLTGSTQSSANLAPASGGPSTVSLFYTKQPMQLFASVGQTGDPNMFRRVLIIALEGMINGPIRLDQFFNLAQISLRKNVRYINRKCRRNYNLLFSKFAMNVGYKFSNALVGNERLFARVIKTFFQQLNASPSSTRALSSFIANATVTLYNSKIRKIPNNARTIGLAMSKFQNVVIKNYGVERGGFNTYDNNNIANIFDAASVGNSIYINDLVNTVVSIANKNITLFERDIVFFSYFTQLRLSYFLKTAMTAVDSMTRSQWNASFLISSLADFFQNQAKTVNYVMNFYKLFYRMVDFSTNDFVLRVLLAYMIVALSFLLPFCNCC
ncbi:hypothetical protein AYI70_g4778 [Smittium culicis]|uniref:Uncharacterized protein n=1 Tax=Smittium culicis TaxID=133412 RepID=A0A1R1XXN9_9FUNG|nr:hypothetical protein AYI70_g4778 [Smittium culicis]